MVQRVVGFLMRLLLVVLLTMNALTDHSYVLAHQGIVLEESRNDIEETTIDTVLAKKELLDGFTTASIRKMGTGGRKMPFDKILMETKDGQGIQRRALEKIISGANSSDITIKENKNFLKSLGESKHPYHYQKNMKESASTRTPRSTTKPFHVKLYKDSNTLPTKASLEISLTSNKLQTRENLPGDEMQRLLEATEEIVNLMHRDYKGMDRPGRKPPINNHEPIH
ncbi:hypothetical protein K2173_025904 [Erythroxylum novogranatense]|uniref:Uncharacterized protein n=1 Tax=Erythroxylum novogranatense TaxID=1862640 RepID=A0AAV8SHJ0_9ROSI|nr:hypothetical protein K2173_025904 [Erythroxylum novogranatense]